MRSKRKQLTIRQFGQRSLTSLFPSIEPSSKVSKVNPESSGSLISLSDFLDRKLDRSSTDSGDKGISSVLSPIGGERTELDHEGEVMRPGLSPKNGFLDEAVFRLFKTKEEAPVDVSKPHCSSTLVILGDDPKPKRKGCLNRTMNKRTRTFYNHYASGSGWWDSDMEGLDSEEVGCKEVWEGMGSTTLGGLEWH
ncbi:hypothetical protein AMTRI_Chr07g77710 [Amborella trichopoda]|uniref:Uncharacterized protein n=1 Tax=Amborella trichopoda TaxID=13333 RepID=W1P0R6_AMBTC|nr:uncharacterized protein LOC18428597 isoform X1 [Amborella trichopoda]ERN00545.1 hypothetical protein AMTR_s00102p00091820 [Amborella trichopoda]|eukprot:XP_006837976.1 uncharacterized protein LOC18428597 isoform X1 [Amborella trichopoda]